MEPSERPEKQVTNASAQAERLTLAERFIDKSAIDMAACIKALSGLVFRIGLSVTMVIFAFRGGPEGSSRAVTALLDMIAKLSVQ